jgi:hypothetical protein
LKTVTVNRLPRLLFGSGVRAVLQQKCSHRNGKTALFLSGIMLKNVKNVKMNICSIPFIFSGSRIKNGVRKMVARQTPEAKNVRIFSEAADRCSCANQSVK